MRSIVGRTLFAGAAVMLLCGATASAQTSTPTPASYGGGYLVFQSADGAFKYWLDGRVQVDAAAYTGSKNQLGNGTEVRRARLGGKATLYRNWHGEIDVDFAENAVEMKDMWVGYEGFKNTLLKFGNYKEPFSLETITSSKYITFMERSYIDNFSPDRHIGLGAVRWGDWWYTTLGVFGQAAGTPDATAKDEGFGITGRIAVAPIHEEGSVLHFGIAASRRTPDAAAGTDSNSVRFRARPETDVTKVRYLTTGRVRNVNYTFYQNAEMSGVFGPANLQGEITRVDVHRMINLPTASFYGGYVSASYFVTGETRPYLMEEAEFDRVIPKSSLGAWELGARWSTLDLNDPSAGVAILGGRGTNYTLGVNWHVNPNFKWMLNYVIVRNDKNAKPDMGPTPYVTGDKFSFVASRFSLAF